MCRDYARQTYRCSGLDFRLTDVLGKVGGCVIVRSGSRSHCTGFLFSDERQEFLLYLGHSRLGSQAFTPGSLVSIRAATAEAVSPIPLEGGPFSIAYLPSRERLG
jgi:hypothetical protein